MLPFHIRMAGKGAVAAGLGLACVFLAERPAPAAGEAAPPLLRPTPLVLKDGRIAKVSIHEVRFAPGQSDITGAARAGLTGLARAFGTDCFLTAQVIGHIEPGEVADDTLNAHRLARARADAVQASLIDQGLPAKAIASVWDWQFMVRDARATLWVFELTAGEDCEGAPLGADLVAQAPRSSEQPQSTAPLGGDAMAATSSPTAPVPTPPVAAAPSSPRAPVPPPVAAAPSSPAAPAARERAIVPAIAAAAPAPAETGVQESQGRGAPGSDPTRTEQALPAVPRVVQPLPAAEPEPAAVARARERRTVAARAAAPAARAPIAATDGGVARDADGAWVITFASNSSYFPAGVNRQLRQLLSEIDSEHRYRVALQVAVSGTTKVAGAKSAQEATRYNKWLAERRMERVRQWLIENANADKLAITPEYLSNDKSRRVVLRLSPVEAS